MENVTLSKSTFCDGMIQRLLLRGRGRSVDSVASSVNRSSKQVCIDNDKSFIYTRKSKGPITGP